METLEMLQAYWWLLIAVLGAALVFLLFVQGGQSMLFCVRDNDERQLIINSVGSKWELTFTTLVVFGGAFFASFPLFYSTSFGGAYWLWMLILLSFVVQAFSYEFRRKRGNIYGRTTYDCFLLFNGFFGCVLLGVAVATFFFGGDFTISKANILNPASPVISQWAPTHGLEAIAGWKNLLLGFTVFFIARTMASLYFVKDMEGNAEVVARMRRRVLVNGLVFVVLFVAFMVVLMMAPGVRFVEGRCEIVENIYFHNLCSMWGLAVLRLAGVVSAVYGVLRGALDKKWNCGIWYAGAGVGLAVLVLFCIAGYNGTAYLPSVSDPASSLTIANSSSSEFTLTVMSWVSLLLPFVIAYISYVWTKMRNKPSNPADDHQY